MVFSSSLHISSLQDQELIHPRPLPPVAQGIKRSRVPTFAPVDLIASIKHTSSLGNFEKAHHRSDCSLWERPLLPLHLVVAINVSQDSHPTKSHIAPEVKQKKSTFFHYTCAHLAISLLVWTSSCLIFVITNFLSFATAYLPVLYLIFSIRPCHPTKRDSCLVEIS